MSDFDLDRLGDVWRQQPDPAEMERLQRTAVAVARRARLAAIVDICAAVAVAAVVVILVLANPRSQTFVMGCAAILVLLGSNVRLRKLRQVELKGLTGTTEDMLDQSIEPGRDDSAPSQYSPSSRAALVPRPWLGFAAAASARGDRSSACSGDPQGFGYAGPAPRRGAGRTAVYLIVSIKRGQQ